MITPQSFAAHALRDIASVATAPPPLPGLALRHRVPLGVSLSSAFYKTVAAAAASPPAWLHCSGLLADSTAITTRSQALLHQQLAAKPAWQLPHPWQTAGAAAAALTASKRRQAAKQQHRGQQQQQQLEAGLLEWESCCQGRSRGGMCVLAYDALDRPAFGASFVERRWRRQLQLSDLQQIDPEVGTVLPGAGSCMPAAAATVHVCSGCRPSEVAAAAGLGRWAWVGCVWSV
jgi:hypothetical protein